MSVDGVRLFGERSRFLASDLNLRLTPPISGSSVTLKDEFLSDVALTYSSIES